jgi:ABC-type multidrug transport system permease subunit
MFDNIKRAYQAYKGSGKNNADPAKRDARQGSNKPEQKPLPKEIYEDNPKLNQMDRSSTLRLSVLARFIAMIKKDLKIVMRSRSSSLIIIFGPLLIVFLVGMAFNTTSLYDLRIATYSPAYSTLTNSVVSDLKDQQYNTIQVESEADCIEGVKLGNYHVCAVFPANMEVSNQANNIIKLYVDESRMNLAYLISNTVSSKVSARSANISMGLTTDLLTTLQTTKAELNAKKSVVSNLITSENDKSLKTQGVSDNLNSMDLEYNLSYINITAVDDAIAEVEDDLNISASTFSDVKDALNELKDGVSTLIEKMDSAIQIRESSVNELVAVRDSIQQDIKQINSLKGSMDSLVAGIEGIKITNAENIVSPVKTDIETVTGKQTHLSYLFPTFVVLIIMFICILLSSTITVREKVSKAYFRNFITPTNDMMFMLGGYFTNIFVVGLQVLVLFLAASYFLKGAIFAVIGPLVLVIAIISTLFIFIGMFIGFAFKSEETSTLGAISVGSLLLFFSNAILPIETLPSYISGIAKYNPFVISESILKKILLFNSTLDAVSVQVYMLVCFVAIFFVLAFVARELTKKRFG